MAATLTSRQAAAIRRAQELGLTRTVDGGNGHFIVNSSTKRGSYYLVDLVDGQYRCSCKAGQQLQPCCHAGAVWLVLNNLEHYKVTLRTPSAPAAVAGDSAPLASRPDRHAGTYGSVGLDDAGESYAALFARPVEEAFV